MNCATKSTVISGTDKKLCYCRGTARRAMLVNPSYVSPRMRVRKVSNSESDLQSHSRAIGNGDIR